MGQLLTQQDIMNLLNTLYEQAVQGVQKVVPSVENLVVSYTKENDNVKDAAKSLINYQIAKCTTSGFVTGLGGLLTLPVAIPANISSVLYIQIRMIAALAHMGGYDVHSDQVQTMVYVCLAGISIDQILKQVGIKFGEKFAENMIKKIPGTVLVKINQKVGFRFITKFGTKGIINLGKALPLVGGFVSGGMDFFETKTIADRAYSLFIEGNTSGLVHDSKEQEQYEIVDENV